MSRDEKQFAQAERYFNNCLMCHAEWHRRLGGYGRISQGERGLAARILELPNGIPTHDSLSDVLRRIDPQAIQETFLRWVQAALPSLSGKQICLGGKTLCGAQNSHVSPVHSGFCAPGTSPRAVRDAFKTCS